MCLGFRDVSGPVYCGLREVSGLTAAAAAAAEAEDGARCRVDIAGALVSPLISAPKLELPLRGLPILNSRLLLLLLALAHQSEPVWAHARLFCNSGQTSLTAHVLKLSETGLAQKQMAILPLTPAEEAPGETRVN